MTTLKNLKVTYTIDDVDTKMNYIVSIPNSGLVIVAFWQSSLNQLNQKYKSSFGNEMKLYVYPNDHYIQKTNEFIQTYAEYCIHDSLYDSKFLDDYKIFFSGEEKIEFSREKKRKRCNKENIIDE